MLDWSAIGPLLRIPHNQDDYRPPGHPHGTHVAGILGADMRPWEGTREDTLIGMCPGIEIYDLRVMGDDGNGDEFGILAALQFVRWLNKQQDQLIIHGVNLSLSLPHAVVNFACGRTPICDECQRLVAEGTVVVAAAGNRGQAVYLTQTGREEGFRTLSITDPGNAEAVITVGSTHRDKPHTYGVSYFSSRGPTGDGRAKPDLLAPGEKILSTVLNGESERMDGTSMAAPHVSGAAALLMARHREMIGQPGRVKEILCKSAVDLGRERYFQGYGLVDVLRALQSL
jgi:subtilisin family serine protease